MNDRQEEAGGWSNFPDMIRTRVEHIRVGMRLSRPIYDDEGRLLLQAGIELRQPFIDRLRELGFMAVYVGDPLEGTPSHHAHAGNRPPPELVRAQTRVAAAVRLRQLFGRLARAEGIDASTVAGVVSPILDEVLANRGAMVHLDEIRSNEGYTFAHSVNVCALATLVGFNLGLTPARLRELAIGALLHDVGKVRLPAEILRKPGPLTAEEMQLVRQHARDGFEMLNGQPGVPLPSAHVAYQHHERLDGSGYPRGLPGEEIHLYARITGVIDVFDAMTADRDFRRAFPPAAVLDALISGAGAQFDANTVQALVAHVAPYPIGCTVRLDTGETAVVVDVNRNEPRRPVVRVLLDHLGRPAADNVEIDLEKEVEREIVASGDAVHALAALT